MNQALNRTELKYYFKVTGGFADQYRRDDDIIVNTFTLSVLMLGTSKEQEDTLKQLMTGRYQARLVHEQRFDR